MSDEYFQEIESRFIARRGTPFVLNPKDYALMKDWHQAGIPLAIVIEAVDAVFDRYDKEDRKVNGLSFCKDAVRKLWRERRDLQVGAASVTPEEVPAALLDALAARLEESPHETVRAWGGRVRDLAHEGSVPRIEERLMEMEEEMIGAVLSSSADADALRAEAASIDVSKLDEKTRARTIEANLRRLVRDRYGLPRLTMF